MGASVSKNVSDAVTRAVAKVSSSIIQNTQLTQDSSQIISVTDVDGDVTITDQTFTQKAIVNMHALLNALSTEESQQSIMQELAQDAKSFTNGLNIAQFSDAQNTMNLLLEATVNLITSIGETCNAFNRQYQTITVERVKGNVLVKNNVFDQMYNIIQNCTEQATSNSKLVQDFSAKLSQTSSATSEGISGWILVALLAVLIGMPVVGGMVFGKALLKFIFPIILVIGIVFLILYYTRGKEVMKTVSYSNFISASPECNSVLLETVDGTYTLEQASDACTKDKNCKAFDWQGMRVLPSNNGYEKMNETKITSYKNISDNCRASIKHDNLKLLRAPNFFKGVTDPPEIREAMKGDVYLNVTTGIWFQLDNDEWQTKAPLTTRVFNRIDWGSLNPLLTQTANVPVLTSPVMNDVYALYHGSNPQYFYVYRYTTEWLLEHKIKGPGLIPAAPPITNTSGFKEIEKPSWMMYTGIAAIVIGAIGSSIVAYMTTREENFEW